MAQERITITDADRKIDFRLDVTFTLRPPAAPRFGWLDGGDPGEPVRFEVDQVELIDCQIWLGKWAMSADATSVPLSAEFAIGSWLRQQYAAEIDEAINRKLDQIVEAQR